MIKLQNKDDFIKLNKIEIHPLIRNHLTKYLNLMLSRFSCNDLSSHGSIVFIENEEDVSLYKEMGLSVPLESMEYDYATRSFLHGEEGFCDISQLIYEVNGKALIVFGVPETIEPIVERHFCYS